MGTHSHHNRLHIKEATNVVSSMVLVITNPRIVLSSNIQRPKLYDDPSTADPVSSSTAHPTPHMDHCIGIQNANPITARLSAKSEIYAIDGCCKDVLFLS